MNNRWPAEIMMKYLYPLAVWVALFMALIGTGVSDASIVPSCNFFKLENSQLSCPQPHQRSAGAYNPPHASAPAESLPPLLQLLSR